MNAPLRSTTGRVCSRPGCWQRDTIPATVDGRPGFLCSRHRLGDSGGPLFTAPALHELPPDDGPEGPYAAWPSMDRVLLVLAEDGDLGVLGLPSLALLGSVGAARREGYLRHGRDVVLSDKGKARVERLRAMGPPGVYKAAIRPDGASNRVLLLLAAGRKRHELAAELGWTNVRAVSMVANCRRYGLIDAQDRLTEAGRERVERLQGGGR